MLIYSLQPNEGSIPAMNQTLIEVQVVISIHLNKKQSARKK